jgi:hypothetical protein
MALARVLKKDLGTFASEKKAVLTVEVNSSSAGPEGNQPRR